MSLIEIRLQVQTFQPTFWAFIASVWPSCSPKWNLITLKLCNPYTLRNFISTFSFIRWNSRRKALQNSEIVCFLCTSRFCWPLIPLSLSFKSWYTFGKVSDLHASQHSFNWFSPCWFAATFNLFLVTMIRFEYRIGRCTNRIRLVLIVLPAISHVDNWHIDSQFKRSGWKICSCFEDCRNFPYLT